MTIANIVESAGAATRRAHDSARERSGAATRTPVLPGWSEPDDIDIQITRVNETEVLENESVWDDAEEDAAEPEPAPKAEGGEGAFSYDEAHGDDAAPKAEPVAVLGDPDEAVAAEPVELTPMGNKRTELGHHGFRGNRLRPAEPEGAREGQGRPWARSEGPGGDR